MDNELEVKKSTKKSLTRHTVLVSATIEKKMKLQKMTVKPLKKRKKLTRSNLNSLMELSGQPDALS